MNSIRKIALSIIMVSFFATACNDDFVNTTPRTEVLDEEVWKDPNLASAFVTEIYGGLGQGGFNEQMLASLTDEALFTHPGRGINTITESRSNPSDRGWMNNTLDWQPMYQRIRACNITLDRLATPQFENTNGIVERLKGEAHFMRAYYHHQLLRYFGGIPIIEKVYELGEDDYTVERNTFAECVDFIVADCDQAAALLDGKSMANGRASKAAALALKSRILLYAASDLHDMPTATANAPLTIGAFDKPELLGYINGDRTERWQKAKVAAKAVIDLPGFGYELDLAAPVTPEEGQANYVTIAMAREGGEKELIFARYFIDAKTEDGAWVGRNNGPNGYHNWAGNTPVQNLVDDYEMLDGTPFDWNDPTHKAAPYVDRDPRFYATILYDGAPWKPRTADGAGKDPANQIQTGQYEITSGGNTVTYFGLDTRKSSIEDWNGTHTGYYMRKFIDPNPLIVDQNTRQQVPWPFFRYTEALLNYAEACIALGEDDEAKLYLNKIRFRSGMPAITETGEALKLRYRNERRVELAYEEHRFHDVRRWMIAPEEFGQKARIITILGELKAGKTVTIYKYDPTNYDYTYTPSDINPGIENRQWHDKMYYLPIHRDEINRNGDLKQNPGY